MGAGQKILLCCCCCLLVVIITREGCSIRRIWEKGQIWQKYYTEKWNGYSKNHKIQSQTSTNFSGADSEVNEWWAPMLKLVLKLQGKVEGNNSGEWWQIVDCAVWIRLCTSCIRCLARYGNWGVHELDGVDQVYWCGNDCAMAGVRGIDTPHWGPEF